MEISGHILEAPPRATGHSEPGFSPLLVRIVFPVFKLQELNPPGSQTSDLQGPESTCRASQALSAPPSCLQGFFPSQRSGSFAPTRVRVIPPLVALKSVPKSINPVFQNSPSEQQHRAKPCRAPAQSTARTTHTSGQGHQHNLMEGYKSSQRLWRATPDL